MSTVYIIDNTAGDSSITIKPGALNGPGGTQRDSDLRLYGLGALQWGEGVDENIYRLAESFSCDQKALGDFLPGGTVGNTDYDPSIHSILPKDESDLGPGNGITVPLNGQLWFNDSTKSVFVYDGDVPEWIEVGAPTSNIDPPTDPTIGQLWFDVNNTGACGYPTLKVYNPDHPDAPVDGFISVAIDYVSKCGDDMSGILNMSIDGGTTRHKITNLGDPTTDYDAVHKKFAVDLFDTNTTVLTNHINNDFGLHLTPTQNTFMDALSATCLDALPNTPAELAVDLCNLHGFHLSTGDVYDLIDSKISETGGALISNYISLTAANPTDGLHAVNRDWVLQQISNSAPGEPIPSIPSGTVMLFAHVNPPDGWSLVSSWDNRFLRVVSGGGQGIGGADDPRTMNKVPAHTHTATTGNNGEHHHLALNSTLHDSTGVYRSIYHWSDQNYNVNSTAYPDQAQTSDDGDHNHTVTVNTNVGNSTWTPRYLDIITCSKD